MVIFWYSRPIINDFYGRETKVLEPHFYNRNMRLYCCHLALLREELTDICCPSVNAVFQKLLYCRLKVYYDLARCDTVDGSLVDSFDC